MLAILSVLALWGRKHPWDKMSQYSKSSLPGQAFRALMLIFFFSSCFITSSGWTSLNDTLYLAFGEPMIWVGFSEGSMLWTKWYIFLSGQSLVVSEDNYEEKPPRCALAHAELLLKCQKQVTITQLSTLASSVFKFRQLLLPQFSSVSSCALGLPECGETAVRIHNTLTNSTFCPEKSQPCEIMV